MMHYERTIRSLYKETGAITTIEYKPGLRSDFPMMLNRSIPKDIEYKHDETRHDGNGHSHVRASLIGPSLTVPFKDRNLILGHFNNSIYRVRYKVKRT